MIRTTIKNHLGLARPRLTASVWLLLWCFNACFAQTDRTAAVSKAEAIIEKVFADNQFPGMAVAVYHDGFEWTEGYGYANIESEEEIDPAKHLFRIGSVSKTLTSAGLMKLWSEGKVSLDDPVQNYVSAFPEKRYPVTVRQVAQHVGGIRHYRGLEFMSNIHYSTVEEGLAIFVNDTLLFEPGSKYSYSSYGWNLISAVMETASGEEFLTYMDNEVFTPLQMTQTYPDDNTLEIGNKVTFYHIQSDEIVPAPIVDNSYKWAGGGFLSTATDVMRFGQIAFDGSFLDEKALEESWTVATLKDGKQTNYGIGWSNNEDKKERHWVGHSGGSVGGTSMLLIYPEEKLVVVTLVNLSGARMGNLAFRIAEQFLSN